VSKLPKLKNPPVPPPPRIRVAQPPKAPEAVVEAPKALPEELWALERADLMRRAAEAEKKSAMLERALVLQVIDPKGKIRMLETIAAESEQMLAKARETHEATIESLRCRLGITGAFDIDSDSGVISTGSAPEEKE
jgi:hypothetical protein